MRRAARWTASVAALLLATGCSTDAVGPKLQAWNQPPPQQTGELSGSGVIPDPEGGVITFTFDVTSDGSGVHGSFSAFDPRGNTLNATSFTAFRSSSGFCATASNGAEFDATGTFFDQGVTSTTAFTVKACDNGPALLGGDTFSIDIAENGFHASGSVVGDIQKH
ncbi:MAG TPA: hypothetical protein VFJ24_02960 [Gaiellales bacterium]|nr:hypothetical protein [Gaiellales bacterium]